MIERLYDVFAMPRPRVVEFCDHCVTPEAVAPFTTVPLRELTSDQVGRFWLKSGTIGDDDFVRYLLPRVMELIAAGELEADFFWLRLVAEAYAKGDPREQAAVREYFLATPVALAGLVREGPKEGPLTTWSRTPETLALLEEAALSEPDSSGVLSDAHAELEAHLCSK
ncbi:hypothetical protein GCM10011609_51460 [Lentzea pudingi]|uniref:Uncharacterized protein n=1 Tax=Lentzea pudingi TaxID=1789439 RepID=A0ABQ2IB67_9PSEU|nr:hypothetical protein [Lentzea pudingi]GGN05827.1 hypothetical protein GCM10011609_51460 [Lentzea pudingi]